MPVIAVVSPKGGAGKSTLANVIATTFYASGASVAIVDCDHNKTQVKWKRGDEELGENIVNTKCDIPVESQIGERNIFQTIDRLRVEKQFVIIDTEGTASLVMSRAIMRSDLVLIPVKPSPNDINGALKALRLIKEEEIGLQRAINYACVMVETAGSWAFKTKIQRNFEDEVIPAGIKILQTELVKREAYRQLFLDRVALHELDSIPQEALDKAMVNANELAGEVFQAIQNNKEAA